MTSALAGVSFVDRVEVCDHLVEALEARMSPIAAL